MMGTPQFLWAPLQPQSEKVFAFTCSDFLMLYIVFIVSYLFTMQLWEEFGSVFSIIPYLIVEDKKKMLF